MKHSSFLLPILLPLAVVATACGAQQSSVQAVGPQSQSDEQRPAEPDDLLERKESTSARQRNTGAALDVHTHLMSPELTTILAGPNAPASTADDLVERLDEGNVKRAVVLSLAYRQELPDEDAVRAENDFTAAEVAKYPDRLIGFCGINPLRDQALDEIDRCANKLDMAGVKLHVASGIDLQNPEHVADLAAVFDRASQHDLPVLMHSGNPLGLPLDSDALTNLAIVIATHREVRLTFAHCTNDSDRDEMEIWLAGLQEGIFNNENLFVETSSCLKFYKDAPRAQKQLMVWRLRTWGLDRVLFGSDYLQVSPVETPAEALKTLKSYPFTRKEIRTILNNDGAAWLSGS